MTTKNNSQTFENESYPGSSTSSRMHNSIGKKLIIILIIISFPKAVCAQVNFLEDEIIASRQLINQDPDSAQWELLHLDLLCEKYQQGDLRRLIVSSRARILNLRAYTDSAEVLILEQLDIGHDLPRRIKGLILTDLAQILRTKRKFDSSLFYLDSAIQYLNSPRDIDLVRRALLEKAQVMNEIHFAHVSLDILEPLLKEVSMENPYSHLIMEIKAHAAMILMYNSASSYGIELGLEVAPDLKNQYLRAQLLRLIGSRIRDFHADSSRQFLYEALEISKQKQYVWVTKSALNSLAEVESLLKNLDGAQHHLDESLTLLPQGARNYAQESDWYQQGHLAYWKEDYHTSIVYSDSGYHAVGGTSMKLDWFFTNMLYWSYKRLNMPDSAFKYSDLNRDYCSDSENRLQNAAMDSFKILMEDLEKRNTIQVLENRNIKEVSRKKSLIVSSLTFLLLGAIVIVYQRNQNKSLSLYAGKRDSEIHQQTLHMIDLNNKLTELEKEANELRKKSEVTYRDIQRILNHIKMTRTMKKEWEKFDLYFGNQHKDFYDTIEKLHPDLPLSSRRVAALVRMQLTNDEIGSIMNVTSKSARMGKYRLKQRLGLGEKDDLYAYLKELSKPNFSSRPRSTSKRRLNPFPQRIRVGVMSWLSYRF